MGGLQGFPKELTSEETTANTLTTTRVPM